MKEYRVTKYNPNNRDSKGSYLAEEWTSISDVGKSITKSEYEEIENAYIGKDVKDLRSHQAVACTKRCNQELGSPIKALTRL